MLIIIYYTINHIGMWLVVDSFIKNTFIIVFNTVTNILIYRVFKNKYKINTCVLCTYI